MKRTLILLVVAAFCTLQMNAQTPCEKTFEKAKNYYGSKDYANAKAQFQKVVNNCDSNKEIAQEYMRLCDGWMVLAKEKEENRKAQAASNVDSKQIKKLNDDISRLEQENEKCAKMNRAAVDKMRSDSSVIVTKSDSITYWKGQYSSIIEPLRGLGKEMNTCLKKCKEYKKVTFDGYDKINDPNDIIDAMSRNLKKSK